MFYAGYTFTEGDPDIKDYADTIKAEPILGEDDRVFGYELLLGDTVVFNKEAFFSRADPVLDLIVLKTHLEFADLFPEDVSLFVNILPETFRLLDEHMLDRIVGRVVLEIREDYCDNSTIERIRFMKDFYGLTISVDDWGQKGSNIDRLIKLQPQFVKLDMTLFKHLPSECAEKILTGIKIMFEELCPSTRIIAEKVENTNSRELIRKVGIELWQGYLSSKLPRG